MEFIFKWKLKHEKRTNIMTKIKKKKLIGLAQQQSEDDPGKNS